MLKVKSRNVFLTVLGAGFLTGAATVAIANSMFTAASPIISSILAAKVFFTSLNVVLLTALSFNYFIIYREMPNPMARGLFIFSLALTMYALTSSPIIHALFGFEIIRLGPFTYLSDMFVAVAATVILYESYR